MKRTIWVGFDQREAPAFAVAVHSARMHRTLPITIRGVVLGDLQRAGKYRREIRREVTPDGKTRMIDVPSDHPMATQHACSRFFVPMLAREGWALFTDGDVLWRNDPALLFEQFDPRFAAYCVKHVHTPLAETKMDGQVQSQYSRKNWTSVIAFNCDHPANQVLKTDLEYLNTRPGRYLHALEWLRDNEIGELGSEWNWLVGWSSEEIEPSVVHFTEGTPDMPGYENVPYADEWHRTLEDWGAAP